MASRLISWYSRHLHAAPLRTKVLSSLVILTAADVSRQTIEGGGIDGKRTARMALFASSVHPVWIHHWFNLVEAQIPSIAAGQAGWLATAGKKMALDQSLSSPIFLGGFLAFQALVESGGDLQAVREKVHANWWTTMKLGWCFWPVAHFVNMALVPLHWRVLYVNFASLGWGTVLSRMASLKPGEQVCSPLDWAADAVRGTQGVGLTKPDARAPLTALVGGWAVYAGTLWRAQKRVGRGPAAFWGVFGGGCALALAAVAWEEPPPATAAELRLANAHLRTASERDLGAARRRAEGITSMLANLESKTTREKIETVRDGATRTHEIGFGTDESSVGEKGWTS